MALSAHVGFIVPQEYKIYHVGPGDVLGWTIL